MPAVPDQITDMLFRGTVSRPLFRLRQVLREGLVSLVRDEEQLQRLLGRADDAPQGSQDLWEVDALKQVRAAVFDQRAPLRVELAYPVGDARLPALALHVVGGRQDAEAATLNARWTRSSIATSKTDADGNAVARLYHEQAFPWFSTIQLSTWVPAPELALLLHDLAIVTLLAFQGQLREAGVSELVDFSEQTPMKPAWQGAPNVPLVPVLQFGLRWRRHVARAEQPVPSRVASLGTTPQTPE